MRRTAATHYTPQARLILTDLIAQPPSGELATHPGHAGLATATHQSAALEHRATDVVSRAREIGVSVDYLGVQPMFRQPRLYDGEPTDWIIGPATQAQDLIVPKAEQAILRRLAEHDIHCAALYVAHEVEKTKTTDIVRAPNQAHTDLTPAVAAEIIGPVPEPAPTVELGGKLGARTTRTLQTMRRTGHTVGKVALAGGAATMAIAAAPLLVAGAAVAALAQLDPIVIGAIPFGEPREGQLAAWVVLAQWQW